MATKQKKSRSAAREGYSTLLPGVKLNEIFKYWTKNCQLHREDGPAVERPNGHEWYLYGKRHREDGPAVERADGYKEYWLNGKLHREDGPAVECQPGAALRSEPHGEWWLCGRLVAIGNKPKNWDKLIKEIVR